VVEELNSNVKLSAGTSSTSFRLRRQKMWHALW